MTRHGFWGMMGRSSTDVRRDGVVGVSVGGERRMVGERTARIIRWLVEQHERVERPDQVEVQVHCSRRSVKVRLAQLEDVPALAEER